MSELFLAFLMTGPLVEPTPRERAFLDALPPCVKRSLWDAGVRRGLIVPHLGENIAYVKHRDTFPEWLWILRHRELGKPLSNDPAFGDKP